MRHESSLASAEHSIMFLPTPRESIVVRWREATSASASFVTGAVPVGQLTVGHEGAGGQLCEAGHCGQLGKSGQRGHVGQRETALSTADWIMPSLGPDEHAGHAGQRAAAAAATLCRSAHGETRG